MGHYCSTKITATATNSEWKEISTAINNHQIDWSCLEKPYCGERNKEFSFDNKGAPTPLYEGEMRTLSKSYPSVQFYYHVKYEESGSESGWYCNGDETDKKGVKASLSQAYKDEMQRFTSARPRAAEGIAHRIEIMPDGRVAADGENRFGECNIFSWSKITQISCGNWHTVGLRKDGTVVACGSNANGQCDVSYLPGRAVAVSCGRYHTAILLDSGKVIVRGHLEQEATSPNDNAEAALIPSDFPLIANLRLDKDVKGWEKMNDRIELMSVGDDLTLKKATQDGEIFFEVLNMHGEKIGNLWSEHAKSLAEMLNCVKATVNTVKPLSARRKGSKYAEMTIRLEYISSSKDGSVKKDNTGKEAYTQTRISSWPVVTMIKSVFDAVIGVTETGEVFVDGFCPCSESDIRKIVDDVSEYSNYPNCFGDEEKEDDDDEAYELDYDEEDDEDEDDTEWIVEEYGEIFDCDPIINFDGSIFVFTGLGGVPYEKGQIIIQKVIEKGGQTRESVSGKTNYLVVNPDHAGCRKIEDAIEQREIGKNIKIILLKDLEKALEDKISSKKTSSTTSSATTAANSASLESTLTRSTKKNGPSTLKEIFPGIDMTKPSGLVVDEDGCCTGYDRKQHAEFLGEENCLFITKDAQIIEDEDDEIFDLLTMYDKCVVTSDLEDFGEYYNCGGFHLFYIIDAETNKVIYSSEEDEFCSNTYGLSLSLSLEEEEDDHFNEVLGKYTKCDDSNSSEGITTSEKSSTTSEKTTATRTLSSESTSTKSTKKNGPSTLKEIFPGIDMTKPSGLVIDDDGCCKCYDLDQHAEFLGEENCLFITKAVKTMEADEEYLTVGDIPDNCYIVFNYDESFDKCVVTTDLEDFGPFYECSGFHLFYIIDAKTNEVVYSSEKDEFCAASNETDLEFDVIAKLYKVLEKYTKCDGSSFYGEIDEEFDEDEEEEVTSTSNQARVEDPIDDEARAKVRAEEWMQYYGKYIDHNPVINFDGSLFVFTGFGSHSFEKDDPIVQKVIEKGGQYRSKVSGLTNYLIVDPSDAGGSKIEAAVEQRKNGKNIQIVLLEDLEKALEGKVTAKKSSTTSEKTTATKTSSSESTSAKSTTKSKRDSSSSGKNSTETVHEGTTVTQQDCEIDSSGVLTGYFGSAKNIILPNGITAIGQDAFFNNEIINSVVIPEGVEKIEDGAFWMCTNLKSVVLPSTIQKIGDNAFNSSGLTSIVIPDGCEEIGTDCFTNCEKLKDIYVSASVCEIGVDAFCTFNDAMVIHTSRGSTADSFAKEHGWTVDYKSAPSAKPQTSTEKSSASKNTSASVDELTGLADTMSDLSAQITEMQNQDLSEEDRKTLNEAMGTLGDLMDDLHEGQTAMGKYGDYLEQQEAREKAAEEEKARKKAEAMAAGKSEKDIVNMYVILTNEKKLGKLDRSQDEFCEIYEDDFAALSKAEIINTRKDILSKMEDEALCAYYTESFKQRSTKDRFTVSTLNLNNVSDEPDYGKKAEFAIENTKEWFKPEEYPEVRKLMDSKLADARKQIDDQLEPVEERWTKFSSAIEFLQLNIATKEPHDSDMEDSCSCFQLVMGSDLVSVKLSTKGIFKMVTNVMNFYPWYWGVTICDIWEAAFRNEIRDDREGAFDTNQIANQAMSQIRAKYPEAKDTSAPDSNFNRNSTLSSNEKDLLSEDQKRQAFEQQIRSLVALSKEPILPHFENGVEKNEIVGQIISRAKELIGDGVSLSSGVAQYDSIPALETLRLTLGQKFVSAEVIIDAITAKKSAEYDRLSALLEKKNTDIGIAQQEIAKLEEERSHLGFFHGKRKKEIAALLEQLKARIKQIEDDYEYAKKHI